MTTTIAREDLKALVEQTWQTLFGDTVEECSGDDALKWDIQSQVTIQGAWSGRAIVVLERETASQVAARMLEAAPDELSREEIVDASGEIANILGGNLKSILPQPSRLGLPRVLESQDGGSLVLPDNESLALHCVWGSARFSVIIVAEAGSAET